MPPLRITPASVSSIRPLMAKPSASSAPSPGVAADQRAAGLVEHFDGAGHHLPQRVFDLGLQPRRHGGNRRGRLRHGAHGEDVAQRMVGGDRPNTQGSSMNARKKSTVCTMALPGGTRMTAASSGECRPISTSSRSIGCSRASARDSTVAPTLAPQPPQRMAMAEIGLGLFGGERQRARRRWGAVESALDIGGNSLKRRMKRRSIQSFQRQTQSPPRRADHAARRDRVRSPVLIRASQRRCGR
jgi:hypothetical protein